MADRLLSESTALPALVRSNALTLPVYGRRPANLRRWHSALAKLRAGIYRPKVVFIGDSKRYGQGAGTTSGNSYSDGAEPRGTPAHFVRQLAARGIPASRQSTFGAGGASGPAIKIAYDPRVSGLTGWGGGSQSLGGVMWSTGSTTTPFVFTPEGPVDTFEIYTRQQAGDGPMAVTADADATVLANIVNNGANGFLKTVVPVIRGAHSINVARASGGAAALMGVLAKDSTIPAVDVINAGVPGTRSDYHVSTAGTWAAANSLATLAPDLVLIQLGTNDLNQAVTVATYTANILDIITKAKATGADVVLEVATFATAGGFGTDAEREAFRQALITLGAAQGCMVVDHAARFGTWTSANALGLMRDGVHETEPGYADQAAALVDALLF